MQESKKLSLAYCAKFLKEHGEEYTDEQVAIIRDVLYTLAELDFLICTQDGYLAEIKPDSAQE